MNILNYRSFVLVMVIAIFFGNVVLIVNSRDESTQQIDQKSTISSKRTLKVVGDGTISATPDIANLRIKVVVQKDTAIQAREQAAQSMQALMKLFKNFNIVENDLRTSGYSLYPEYLYEKNRINRIVAFNVSNNLNVTIRNLDDLGAVIDAAITEDSEGVRVDNVSFSIDDDQSYKQKAREKAVQNAYSVAQQIAGVANQNLGQPLEITDLAYKPYEGPVGFSRAMMSDESFTSTPISPGQIIIESKVEIIFAMQ